MYTLNTMLYITGWWRLAAETSNMNMKDNFFIESFVTIILRNISKYTNFATFLSMFLHVIILYLCRCILIWFHNHLFIIMYVYSSDSSSNSS